MIVPTLEIEEDLWSKGYNCIIGIDEVGRGSWAGPFVAAGVILPKDFQIPEGLADSKLLKHGQRVKIAEKIQAQALSVSIIQINPQKIDKLGLSKIIHIAFRKVVSQAAVKPDYCLIDAFFIRGLSRKNQLAVKNGDKICASIAAASVVAKVYRDKIMRSLHFKYPQYSFGRNKGYGTSFHRQAIKQHGLCPQHRKSYDLGLYLP